jgi:hypothetical protein
MQNEAITNCKKKEERSPERIKVERIELVM